MYWNRLRDQGSESVLILEFIVIVDTFLSPFFSVFLLLLTTLAVYMCKMCMLLGNKCANRIGMGGVGDSAVEGKDVYPHFCHRCQCLTRTTGLTLVDAQESHPILGRICNFLPVSPLLSFTALYSFYFISALFQNLMSSCSLNFFCNFFQHYLISHCTIQLILYMTLSRWLSVLQCSNFIVWPQTFTGSTGSHCGLLWPHLNALSKSAVYMHCIGA